MQSISCYLNSVMTEILKGHVCIFRSHGHSSRQNGGGSESSDLSSVELELLPPTFAIQRSSAPTIETLTREKVGVHTNSIVVNANVPVLSVQRGQKTLNGGANDKHSYSSSSNESDISKNSFHARSKQEIITPKSSAFLNTVPKSSALTNTATRSSGVGIDVKRPESKAIEKKGGVTQVDFRGVLKKVSGVHPNDADSNGHSKKLVSNIDLTRPKSNESGKDLSQRKAIFEGSSQNKPNSVLNGKSHSGLQVKHKDKVTTDKLDSARKQFESNVSNTQNDFRSVLKTKADTSGIGKDNFAQKLKSNDKPKASQALQHDFRSVLKQTKEFEEKDSVNKKPVDTTYRRSSEHKVKIPSAFENSTTFARKRSNPGLSLDISREKPKPDFARSSRGDRLKEITEKLEFKTVSNPSGEKTISEGKSDGDVTILRPIPRRLSQTKPSNMETSPRRLSQSKTQVSEVKPVFKDRLENKSVEYGKEVVLECQVAGTPNPDIFWSVNNKEIKVGSKII